MGTIFQGYFEQPEPNAKSLILTIKELKEMARIRLVSRTIKTYTYKVTVFDKETDKLLTVDRIITGDKPTEKELLSELSTNTQVAVKADFLSYKEDMYVMKETDFIKYAHKTLDGKRSITADFIENDEVID